MKLRALGWCGFSFRVSMRWWVRLLIHKARQHLLPCLVSIAPKEMPINWSCDSPVPPPSASQASVALSSVFVLSPFF